MDVDEDCYLEVDFHSSQPCEARDSLESQWQPPGFVNPGNWCWFNSLTHVLLSIPCVLKTLLRSETPVRGSQLQRSFASLARVYCHYCSQQQQVALNPLNSIQTLLSLHEEQPSNHLQHDAVEYCITCVFALQLHELFTIRIPDGGRRAGQQPLRSEAHSYIQLSYLQKDVNEGVRSWLDDHFANSATDSSRLPHALPPCLLIAIDRAENDHTTKNNQEATFPKQLTGLSTECGGSAHALQAVLMHQGTTLRAGHYWVFIRCTGGWFQCEDTKILRHEWSHAELQRFCSSNAKFSVAALVYTQELATGPFDREELWYPTKRDLEIFASQNASVAKRTEAGYDSEDDPRLPMLALTQEQKKKVQHFKKVRSTLQPTVKDGAVDKRDATETTLRGSYYQAAMTVLRWINCKSNEHVLIEFGEDITTIFSGLQKVTAQEQAILAQDSDEAAIKAIINDRLCTTVQTSQVKVHGDKAGQHRFNLHSEEVVRFLVSTVDWLRTSNLPKSIIIASEFHTTSVPNVCKFGTLVLPAEVDAASLILLDTKMRTIERWNKIHTSPEESARSSKERKQTFVLFRSALLAQQKASEKQRAKGKKDVYPRTAPSKISQRKWCEFCEYVSDDTNLHELIRTVRFSYERPGAKLKNNFLDVRQACMDALNTVHTFKREPVVLFNHLLEAVVSKCFEPRSTEDSSDMPGLAQRKILSRDLLLKEEKASEKHSRIAVIHMFTKRVLNVEFRSCRDYIRWSHTVAAELLAIPVAASHKEDEHDSLVDAWGASMLAGKLFRQYGHIPSPGEARLEKIQKNVAKSYDRVQQRTHDFFQPVCEAPGSAAEEEDSASEKEKDEETSAVVASRICRTCKQVIRPGTALHPH